MVTLKNIKLTIINNQKDLVNFLNQKQLAILVLIIISIGFLYLNQTSYFKSYMDVSGRTVLFLCWILAIFMMGIKAYVSFLFAIATFMLAFVLENIGVHFWAVRITTYTYYFLLLGTIQYKYELYRISKK